MSIEKGHTGRMSFESVAENIITCDFKEAVI
jgi:hypothetical protein